MGRSIVRDIHLEGRGEIVAFLPGNIPGPSIVVEELEPDTILSDLELEPCGRFFIERDGEIHPGKIEG